MVLSQVSSLLRKSTVMIDKLMINWNYRHEGH